MAKDDGSNVKEESKASAKAVGGAAASDKPEGNSSAGKEDASALTSEGQIPSSDPDSEFPDVPSDKPSFTKQFAHAINDRTALVQTAIKKFSGQSKEDPKLQKRLDALQDSRAHIEHNNNQKWYKRVLSTPISGKKLPIGVKILGVLCMVLTAVAMVFLTIGLMQEIDEFRDGVLTGEGVSTIVVGTIYYVDLFLLDISFLFFGILLFSGRRVVAALLIYVQYILLIAGASCSIMLFGVNWRLIIYAAMFAVLIGAQIYLDPYLREERELKRLLTKNEIKKEQETGTLGRDRSGKGFIELNFFNLFWIFVVCSFLGDMIESVVHITLVDPGHWQDRAGLLFGPFSPIYGFGALLMTIFLNRLYKANIIVIFLLSAIIGGAFEYFVSWWMQYTYGAVAWDYTGQFLSIGGRTCGWAMGCWGLLGCIWIKLLLPGLLWLINRIPWNWRYPVTFVAAAFMAVDCIMTLESLDCWYERLSGDPVDSNIQKFYAHYFDNAYMADRFQSMTIDPSNAIRGGH